MPVWLQKIKPNLLKNSKTSAKPKWECVAMVPMIAVPSNKPMWDCPYLRLKPALQLLLRARYRTYPVW